MGEGFIARRVALICCVLCAFAAPGTASATHVQCGDVITSDTTLDSDLVDCPLSGIVIGADGVVLDLNGHTVDGPGQGASTTHAGIDDNGGFDGVTIRNGTVREFETGIKFFQVGGSSITSVSVVSTNGRGVWLVESHRNGIERSLFNEAVSLEGSDENVIAHNDVFDSGITVTGTEGNVIEKNDIGRVASNTIFGISLFSSTQTRVAKNDIRDSILGIELSQSPGNVIEANTVERSFEGIVIGELFAVQSRDNLIVGNRVSENRDDGLEVRVPGNTITANTANFNRDLGIEAVAGNTDGGHNKARGNGNPAQCVNVSCK